MPERGFFERRRTPRINCGGRDAWKLSLKVPVRLLDVSHGGAYFATDVSLPMIDGTRLRVRLAGHPFDARLRLLRSYQPHTVSGAPQALAAAFTSMEAGSRAAMEQFLRAGDGLAPQWSARGNDEE